MIYHVTKGLMISALRAYFRSVEYIGKENLNSGKPTIYIVNHPSALLDPLVAATIIKDKIHFIAAAEFFKKGIVKWIFKNEFNMLPVYRPGVKGAEDVDNDQMFRECYECLRQSGSIMIFPEGDSRTEKRLRDLKTGTMRIYHGALKQMPAGNKIDIIPIGLNYSNPHQYQSKVVVSIGKPVDFSHCVLPDTITEQEKIKLETQFLQSKLREHVISLEDKTIEQMYDKISSMIRFDLWREFNVAKDDTKAKFRLQKQLADALIFTYQAQKDQLTNLTQKINDFNTKLKRLKLPEDVLRREDIGNGTFLLVIFLFPFFVTGTVLNFVPYQITKLIFDKLIVPKVKPENVGFNEPGISPQFQGTLLFSIGLIIFLLWYVGLTLATAPLLSGYWHLLLLPLGYISGNLASKWLSAWYWLRKKFSLFVMSKTKPDELSQLLKEKSVILTQLHQLKSDFLLRMSV